MAYAGLMGTLHAPPDVAYNVPVPETKTKFLKVRLDEKENSLFNRYAKAEGLSVSAFVRTHVLAYIEKKGPLRKSRNSRSAHGTDL